MALLLPPMCAEVRNDVLPEAQWIDGISHQVGQVHDDDPALVALTQLSALATCSLLRVRQKPTVLPSICYKDDKK